MSEKLQNHIAGIPTLKDQNRSGIITIALPLTPGTLSRLAGLCEREAARLEKFATDHADHAECQDAVADADNDGTYYRALAKMLRDATL